MRSCLFCRARLISGVLPPLRRRGGDAQPACVGSRGHRGRALFTGRGHGHAGHAGPRGVRRAGWTERFASPIRGEGWATGRGGQRWACDAQRHLLPYSWICATTSKKAGGCRALPGEGSAHHRWHDRAREGSDLAAEHTALRGRARVRGQRLKDLNHPRHQLRLRHPAVKTDHRSARGDRAADHGEWDAVASSAAQPGRRLAARPGQRGVLPRTYASRGERQGEEGQGLSLQDRQTSPRSVSHRAIGVGGGSRRAGMEDGLRKQTTPP